MILILLITFYYRYYNFILLVKTSLISKSLNIIYFYIFYKAIVLLLRPIL